jgi:hypothetical protein
VSKIWLIRCAALLILGLGAYWAVRLAWADHLAASVKLADRERAVLLAPHLASILERLAEKREEAGADPLPDLERAVRLDPANTRRLERLGQRAELAGDLQLAEASLLRAAQLSRLYQPRYLLAQFYFRRQNIGQWDHWTSEALARAYGDITPLLDLMWRLKPDGAALAHRGAAERPALARQFLSFLLRNQPASAAPLARHIAESGGLDDLPVLYRYCDEALVKADVAQALEVWNILCRRNLLPYTPLDPARGASLTNGDFQHRAVSAGFDWHLEPAAGIGASQAANGLRVTLYGSQPEAALIAWQYVPLRSGASYRLSFEESTEDIGWSVYSPAAGGWRELAIPSALEFRAPAGVVRLALMYRRPHGSPRAAAEVLIRKVRLEMQP